MKTKINKLVIPVAGFISLLSCSNPSDKAVNTVDANHDKVWHYSIIDAMRRGIYEGTHTVEELKNHGDFGLGTFNHLNGELIALNGVIYRIPPSGLVEVAADTLKSPFTSLSFFKAEQKKSIRFSGNFEELQKQILEMLPSKNLPYAIKVEGKWNEIIVGGADPIPATDTTALATLMETRPQYNAKVLKGTMVGYFTPSVMSNIDLSPFHFHFISQDKKFAGHLMTGILKDAEIVISIDEKTGYDVELLNQNQRFKSLEFENRNGAATY